MKLDRHTGRPKYSLILNRKLTFDRNGNIPIEVSLALRVLDMHGLLAQEGCGTPGESFPIMLKDEFAKPALISYAAAARDAGMHEYAKEVEMLAARAGRDNPWCKRPD